jgi:hypothetical protein
MAIKDTFKYPNYSKKPKKAQGDFEGRSIAEPVSSSFSQLPAQQSWRTEVLSQNRFFRLSNLLIASMLY